MQIDDQENRVDVYWQINIEHGGSGNDMDLANQWGNFFLY